MVHHLQYFHHISCDFEVLGHEVNEQSEVELETHLNSLLVL